MLIKHHKNIPCEEMNRWEEIVVPSGLQTSRRHVSLVPMVTLLPFFLIDYSYLMQPILVMRNRETPPYERVPETSPRYG